jgi:hypothetical protein
VRHTDTASLAAEIGPKGFHSPLLPDPTIETQFVQEPLSSATELSRMTDQEAQDLLDDCLSAARAALAASRCIGLIDETELSQVLFLRFSQLPEVCRHRAALKTSSFRLIIDQHRRNAKRRTFDERSSDVVEEDPVERFDRREAAVVLLTKIRATLTPTENALLAFFLECEAVAGEHRAYAVVGEALGKRANTIAVCVSRIRMKAARFLDKYEENFLD